jgi:hypothetical protein
LKATTIVQTTAEIREADTTAKIVRLLFGPSVLMELPRGVAARHEGSGIGNFSVRASAHARERVCLGLADCRFDLTVRMARAMSCGRRAPHRTK